MTEKDNPPETVSIIEMTRYWWIRYKWVMIQEVGHNAPLYLLQGLRPIEEAAQAAKDFDCWMYGKDEQ